MSDSEYRGGSTTGGRWGCGFAILFGLPVGIFLTLVAAMGDCMPGVQCHKGILLDVILPTAALAAVIGFGSRWIINAAIRRRRDDR
ncbi:hypothetical protein HZF05_12785 [Sphingomonas sp. CGMCC 1.13654]|uniref:Uncharacterized protein n=1 Tax=Sphingomonas chungangi TaxID=2683589 RepID=A0A838L8H3_9SPHN|nr:hypothetical protein [Sphingomonas chungangi]MBA2934975.1 hypothetical protein [Sphingomonas chungangi]MVW58285.1 hypothetical protein [Sphingomonas chungangi]